MICCSALLILSILDIRQSVQVVGTNALTSFRGIFRAGISMFFTVRL